MTNWPVLDLAIGLAFLYFILSVVCSSVNEAIASVINLRGKMLERWIAGVVADPTTLSTLQVRLDAALAAAGAPEALRSKASEVFTDTQQDVQAAKDKIALLIAEFKISPDLAAKLDSAMAHATSVENLATNVYRTLEADGGVAAAKPKVVALLEGSPAARLAASAKEADSVDELEAVVQQVGASVTDETLVSYRKAGIDRFYADPIVQGIVKQPKRLRREPTGKAKRPAYMPASMAIATFLNQASDGKVDQANFEQIVEGLPTQLQAVANTYATEIGGDIERLRARLENFYDEAMQRVSGWYKRRVQLILAILSVLVAVGLNADTLVIGDTLWSDPTVRSVVVAQATTTATDDPTAPKAAKPIKAALDDMNALNVPLGWTRVTEDVQGKHHVWNWPASPHGWVAKFIGLIITAFALMLGAPF